MKYRQFWQTLWWLLFLPCPPFITFSTLLCDRMMMVTHTLTFEITTDKGIPRIKS